MGKPRSSLLALRARFALFVLLCCCIGVVLTAGGVVVSATIIAAGSAADRSVAIGTAQRLHVLNDMYHDESMGL